MVKNLNVTPDIPDAYQYPTTKPSSGFFARLYRTHTELDNVKLFDAIQKGQLGEVGRLLDTKTLNLEDPRSFPPNVGGNSVHQTPLEFSLNQCASSAVVARLLKAGSRVTADALHLAIEAVSFYNPEIMRAQGRKGFANIKVLVAHGVDFSGAIRNYSQSGTWREKPGFSRLVEILHSDKEGAGILVEKKSAAKHQGSQSYHHRRKRGS